MIHREFMPQDRTVNKEVMRRLRETLHSTELWTNKSQILQHDKLPPHEFLTKNKNNTNFRFHHTRPSRFATIEKKRNRKICCHQCIIPGRVVS